MEIYNYDKDTKEFLFVSTAQPNPMSKGEYLYPKNSTTVVPPILDKNKTAVFNGEYWNIVPDYRGQKQIKLETKEVFDIKNFGELDKGYMLYSDYLLTDEYKKYQQEQALEQKKAEILIQIKSVDEKRIRAVCEPSIKDESTGQTWLDYYNSQILELRNKLAEVNDDTSC